MSELLLIGRLLAKAVAAYVATVFFAAGVAILVSAIEGCSVKGVFPRIETAIAETAPIYFATFLVGIPVAVTLAIWPGD